MKYARRLRQEVDLWGVTWQQVETFVDRISGAADSDASARRLVEALLAVAAVVERARQPIEPKALGAPVCNGFSWPPDPWSPTGRAARLPGWDDVELAAGPVSAVDAEEKPIDGDLTLVRLMAARWVPVRVDPRAGKVVMGAMPSYDPSAQQAGTSIVGAFDCWADIEGEDGELAGLFSVARRVVATMGTEPDVEQVRTWGELAASRRAAVDDDTKIAADPPSAAGRAAVLAGQATALVDGIRAGTIPVAAAGPALTALMATPAVQGNATGTADANTLTAAGQVLDDEGVDDASLAGDVAALAAAFRGTPAAQQALVTAIASLASAPTSTSRQDAVLGRARALGVTSSAARLLSSNVEDGPLRSELDKAVATRLHYPDGSLRMLRALEAAFAWTWPQRVKWFTTRRDLILAPLVAHFRAPFHASLRALIAGGDTGLLALGLTVGPSLAVGATQVVTGEPASLLSSVDDIEPGQVGVVGGDRPAAVTILGVGAAHDRVALDVASVRVSVAAGGPGVAGLIAGGAAIGATAAGLTPDELRSGESADGPAADGLVAATLALWSRSCAVFGRAGVESASAPVPDPVGGPLEHLTLHGTVPARATTLVLTDLPAAMWDRTEPGDPVPRVVRAGEVLLLRGTMHADGEPATSVQGVVEVDTVVRTTGSVLDAMDLSAAGRLSGVALEIGDGDPPPFRCGPEDDVAVVTLRANTVDVPLGQPVTLRRDFAGFDVMSLAVRRMLPPELFGGTATGPPELDRSREFAFANDVFAGWLGYAQHG